MNSGRVLSVSNRRFLGVVFTPRQRCVFQRDTVNQIYSIFVTRWSLNQISQRQSLCSGSRTLKKKSLKDSHCWTLLNSSSLTPYKSHKNFSFGFREKYSSTYQPCRVCQNSSQFSFSQKIFWQQKPRPVQFTADNTRHSVDRFCKKKCFFVSLIFQQKVLWFVSTVREKWYKTRCVFFLVLQSSMSVEFLMRVVSNESETNEANRAAFPKAVDPGWNKIWHLKRNKDTDCFLSDCRKHCCKVSPSAEVSNSEENSVLPTRKCVCTLYGQVLQRHNLLCFCGWIASVVLANGRKHEKHTSWWSHAIYLTNRSFSQNVRTHGSHSKFPGKQSPGDLGNCEHVNWVGQARLNLQQKKNPILLTIESVWNLILVWSTSLEKREFVGVWYVNCGRILTGLAGTHTPLWKLRTARSTEEGFRSIPRRSGSRRCTRGRGDAPNIRSATHTNTLQGSIDRKPTPLSPVFYTISCVNVKCSQLGFGDVGLLDNPNLPALLVCFACSDLCQNK